MVKKSNFLFSILALVVVALACANPLSGTAPAAPANVETIVAATLAALTASAPETNVAPLPATESLLPASLYFLNTDGAGLTQVYRLAMEGVTVTQLTFEPAGVEEYDVSQVDGSIAYVINNQLFTIHADGGNRSMLVDGGPSDPNNPLVSDIINPLWSPNGETIAFGKKGINFYSIGSGQSNLARPAQIDSNGFGQVYWPESYAPDGSKLIITIAPIASDGTFSAIYYPNGNALIELTSPSGEGGSICCSFNWTADSSYIYAGIAFLSPFTSAGLWRVNASDGWVETLLASDEPTETFNLAAAPFLGPDGQLYFIYASQSGLNNFSVIAPLQLVRSAPDGVTNRTVLRPESFAPDNEFLWSPDASFVIAANPSAQLFYTDGRPVVSLVPSAMEMKWGP